MTVIPIQQLPQNDVLQFFQELWEVQKWSFPVEFMTVVN
ncbi:hypothetical protein ABH968_001322 [Lysinibacillus sp. RC79]